MKILRTFLLAATLSAAPACAPRHDTSDALPLGTHQVSVRPRCTSKQINNPAPSRDLVVYNLTCGDTLVTIRNEELFVNGKSYGALGRGDAVHVEGAEVFVNSGRVEERAARR